MHLTLVGLSHKTAPIEIREKLTFPAHRQAGGARAAHLRPTQVAEAVILSTCNRTEIYAVTAGRGRRRRTRSSTSCATYHDLDRARARPLPLHRSSGEAVVRHLFRVVASLDSMVVGEAQILGQVKEAYDHAFDNGAVGPRLQQAVPPELRGRASACAPRPTSASRPSRSATRPSSWRRRSSTRSTGRTILVVGAGKMSELTAKHLVANGVQQRARRQPHLRARGRAGRDVRGRGRSATTTCSTRMRDADIVISSTAAHALRRSASDAGRARP